MSTAITVFVVDNDEAILRAMERLMRANGFRAICFQSMGALLQKDLPSNGAVLLLDVKTVRQFAETLQEPFQSRGLTLPVIFLTDCDTQRTRQEARHMGANGFFRKPVDEQALCDAINFAADQTEPAGTDKEPDLNRPSNALT